MVEPGSSEQEYNQTNNTRASAPIGIGHLPDFTVPYVSGPQEAGLGETFTVEVMVCNQGTASGSTPVQLLLSEDSTLDSHQDAPMTVFSTGPLQPGECTMQQVPASSPASSPMAGYLGAVANPGQSEQELIGSNNAIVGGLISIGMPPQ